jgi:hypothetical protein
MPPRVHVDAYSGYKANERPRQFCLDNNVFEIAAVEDRWYDPNAEYFKVRTVEGKAFLLRCDAETGEWSLQSGFDGADLVARPGITLITIEPPTIRAAEQRIAGCEQCREERADLPFNCILADILGKRGAYDFILSEPGRCPNCRSPLSEKSLVVRMAAVRG